MTMPIKTSERLPTEADADDNDQVWAWNGTGLSWCKIPYRVVRHHQNKYTQWAPRTKQPMPEPIRRERRQFWINRYSFEIKYIGWAYQTQHEADRGHFMDRIECIHVREVLPCDPTPEQIDEARDKLRDLVEQFPNLSCGDCERIMAEIAKLLGVTACGS